MKPEDLAPMLTAQQRSLAEKLTGEDGMLTPTGKRNKRYGLPYEQYHRPLPPGLAAPRNALLARQWSAFCASWVLVACAMLGLYDGLIQ